MEDLTPQEEAELKEMFFFESQERHQKLNELLTALEPNPDNLSLIDEILRITHTMKGNAMGMRQTGIAELSHTLEEVLEKVNNGEISLSKELFGLLYKLTDKIGLLINNVKDGKRVSHKGIKTKIQVFIRESIRRGGTEALENTGIKQAEAISNNNKSDEVVDSGSQLNDKEAHKQPEQNQTEISKSSSNWIIHATEKIKTYFERLFEVFSSNNTLRENPPSADDSEFVTGLELNHDESPDSSASNEMRMGNSGTSGEEPSKSLRKEDRPNNAIDDEASVMEMFEDDYVQEPSAIDELHNKVTMADMVQVPIRKLDTLMNQVGQLIIERDRLISTSSEGHQVRKSDYAGLQRITSDLQYSVMDVRLVQVGTLFSKFHRVARDAANIEGKEVNLVIKGSEVEIDRNILQIISDSMVHMVRNAVGHGIETADFRQTNGKSKVGTITLEASSEKDNVIIKVSDDGRGIDHTQIRKKVVEKNFQKKEFIDQLSNEEVLMYIFESGFSNADKTNEISGRGVGMDVVKKSTESIGGQVEIETELGKGTTISLKLPASMVVKGVLMFMMGDQEFAVALPYTEAVISLKKHEIRKVGVGLISTYLDQTISVIFLKDLLKVQNFKEIYEREVFHNEFEEASENEKLDVIVITHSGKYYGVVVDKLLQQKDIIEKPLPSPLDGNKLLSGTTIMGNGNVCLILDPISITDILFTSRFKIQEHLKAS